MTAPKDPAVRSARGRAGKAKSPWTRTPACLTTKADKTFARTNRPKKPSK